MKSNELRIAPTLALSVGMLVLAAVALVLAIQWNASRNILSDLTGRILIRNLEIVSQGLSGHLDPVRHQVENLADMVEAGSYNLEAKERLADLALGSLATSPQIAGVIIMDRDGQAIRLRRSPHGGRHEVSFPNLGAVSDFRAVLTEAEGRVKGYWGELFYNPELEVTLINYRRPLRKDGEFIGVIAAAVTMNELSGLMAKLGNIFGNTTFLMYGDDKVLAHPNLVTRSISRTASEPAIPVERIGDSVISALGNAVPSNLADLSSFADVRFSELEADGKKYYVLQKPVRQYGETPLVIGIHRTAAEVDAPLRLLYNSGLIGLGILFISLLGAVWISQAIARPLRAVTNGVTKVGELSFADVQPVNTTWVREVSDLARSFNGMLGGLRSFETYVPRTLVQSLIQQGIGAEVESEERDLTVMFTDIAGFTSMCEGMTAKEVAAFINEHITLLVECIEAEGGTIDKYIGDSVMAFWGAPEPFGDAAERACRAAKKMVGAMAASNKQRMSAGKDPVRIRVGIHTGPLVVGNIGAPSRVNYTVVGDTVNTTQRLESLGKEVAPDDEVIVLLSETTRGELSAEFHTKPAGSFHVKGRIEPVLVHQLIL